MEFFTIEELCKSSTAKRLGINNWPDKDEIFVNLNNLVDNVLDPARLKLGAAITINSGYRSYETNIAVGGAKNSQHRLGCAADTKCKDLEKLWKIYHELDVDQCLYYKKKGFIHVSYVTNRKNRNQYIIV